MAGLADMYKNPAINTAIGFTPVLGDIQSGYETIKSAKEGEYLEAALNALGLLPYVPSLGKFSAMGGLAGIVSKNGLDEVIQKLANQGVHLDASANPNFNRITLSKITVPQAMRNQGNGTKAMEELANYADKENATIQLSPSTEFGASSLKRLKEFYKNLDYIENKGRYRDLSLTESMYRQPRKNRQED